MLKSFSRLALTLAATAAFGVSASPAAAEIVRTSAGVLAPGYVQIVTLPSGGTTFGSSVVRHNPTNTIVCLQLMPFGVGSITCNAYWVAGYTKTGNGWEVTKP